jgi:hypothetical protein
MLPLRDLPRETTRSALNSGNGRPGKPSPFSRRGSQNLVTLGPLRDSIIIGIAERGADPRPPQSGVKAWSGLTLDLSAEDESFSTLAPLLVARLPGFYGV